MNKSFFNLILITPLLINFLMIIIMMNPSKLNKFNPLSMLIILILLTFSMSLKMNLTFNSWLSFILFLTMIGGLMIIFLYVISLINNELMYLNLKLILMNLIKIIPFIIMMIMLMYLNNFYFNINSFILLNNSIQMFEPSINSLYMKFYSKSSIFIMIYLYYSMICIMNICSNYKLPLRQLTF